MPYSYKEAKIMDYLLALLIFSGILFAGIAIFLGVSIFKMPILFDSAHGRDTFEITEEGSYDIWCRSRAYKLNNLGSVRPQVTSQKTGGEVVLNRNNIPIHKNNLTTGSINLFSFYGYVGKYSLKTVEGSSLSGVQQMVSQMMVSKEREAEAVTFYIKKKMGLWKLMLFIFLCIMSPLMIILGTVFFLVF